jgi:hypothetical protein
MCRRFLHLPKARRVDVQGLDREEELTRENPAKIVVHTLRRLWESALRRQNAVGPERVTARKYGASRIRAHASIVLP